MPRPVHNAIVALASVLPGSDRNMSLDFVLRRGLGGVMERPALWNPLWLAPLRRDEIAEVFHRPISLDELYSEVIESWDGCESPHLADRALTFYTRFYLGDQLLTKADRAAMAVSLEVRAPFLDYDLVEFVRRLPWTVKVRGGTTKWLLRHALRRRLPPAILHRRKKGFGIPMRRWLADLAPPPPVPSLNDDWLRTQWTLHADGKVDQRLGLFSWLALGYGLRGAA